MSAVAAAVLGTAPSALFGAAKPAELPLLEPEWGEPAAVGFECRLSSAGPIDVGFCLRPRAEILPAVVDAIFLEFDANPDLSFSCAPLVFYRFGAGIDLATATSASSSLGIHTRSDAWSDVASSYGATTLVTDIGLLDARASGAVRLGLLVDRDVALVLARSAPWGAESRRLVRLLELLTFAGDKVRVQIDVKAQMVFVGVELVASQTISGGGTWRPLLDALERDHLCSQAEADAIIAWPGVTGLHLAGEQRAVHRTVSHLKVSHRVGAGLRAKVYLFATDVRPFS